MGAQTSILVICSLGGFLEIIDFGFEVFEMTLLPLSKGTLGCTILCLTFLMRLLAT